MMLIASAVLELPRLVRASGARLISARLPTHPRCMSRHPSRKPTSSHRDEPLV